MNQCKSIGCVAPSIDDMWCGECYDQITGESLGRSAPSVRKPQEGQSSGGDNDYWLARIVDPKRLEPYVAECDDLIEYFQFSFAEGNAFKALWRMGMDRVAQGKPGDTPLRNAEKVAYYGARMVVTEQRKLQEA